MEKIILVTGANRGIGKAIAQGLSDLGHIVWIGARKSTVAQKTAQEIGGQSRGIQLDVTSEEDIQHCFSKIDEEHGKLDVLINNAGIMSQHNQIVGSMQDIRNTMETNFFAAMNLAQTLVPLLAKSTEGRIINLSSGLGAWKDLDPNYAGYRFSKVALNAFTIMFAQELASKNIKVNSMCPGWVKTAMGGSAAPRNTTEGADTAIWLATENNIPTGRFFRDRKEIDF